MMFSSSVLCTAFYFNYHEEVHASFLKKLEWIPACTCSYFNLFFSDQAQHIWTIVGCLETYHFVKILAAGFGAHVACTVTFYFHLVNRSLVGNHKE